MKQPNKALSLLLAAAMTVGLSVPALAAEEDGKIVILHTNDVHCGIDQAADDSGAVTNLGYATVAAYKDKMEQTYGAENVTLVDAGDAIQGGPIGTLSKGSYIVDIMNQVGYDLAIPGNHEFDYGMDNFLTLAKEQAQYTYLCANLTDLEGNPVLDAYKLVEYGDVTVGYVGIDTPESFTKSTPTYFQDAEGNYIYSFAQGNEGKDLYDAVQTAVDEATEAGADYVVAIGHLGNEGSTDVWTSKSVIANTTGIDVFIDGHSHESYEEIVKNADGEDVYLAQTGTKLASIGQVVIDTATGDITCSLVSDFTEADAETADFIAKINDEFADVLQKVVAKTDVALTTLDPVTGERAVRSAETNLGDLCADAYRAMLGADIAFVNGGGIRADIAAGDITYQNIIDVHPFGNMLCVVEATGQQILDALEMAIMALPTESGGFLHVSGLSFSVDTSVESPVVLDAMGNFVEVDGARRVSNVEVAGEAIDPEGTYTVASHNYMLKQGGDGFTMFMGDKLLVDESMADNEVLITYITEDLGGVVPETYAEPQGRIVIDGTSEPVEEGLPFTDVAEGAWYYDYVVTAYENSLMLGVSDTAFAPNTELTRGMMVTMLYRLAGSPEVTGSASDVFADAEDDSWYSDAVVWADQNGLFEALALETLDADAVITREELAEMLYAYEVAAGAEAVEDAELTWADAAEVSADAVSAVAYCTDAGLMNGVSDTEFDPDGSATRAMCATVLVRLFEAGELEAAA